VSSVLVSKPGKMFIFFRPDKVTAAILAATISNGLLTFHWQYRNLRVLWMLLAKLVFPGYPVLPNP